MPGAVSQRQGPIPVGLVEMVRMDLSAQELLIASQLDDASQGEVSPGEGAERGKLGPRFPGNMLKAHLLKCPLYFHPVKLKEESWGSFHLPTCSDS